ncbi:putative ribonuclease H-like domain-containing protein [Tanacetum coccineum]
MKNQGTPEVKGKNWNKIMERELGEGYSFIKKKCFVCGSLSHLIKDCNFYEKKMAREAELKKQRVFIIGKGWQNQPNINTVRTNVNSVRKNVNSVRPKVNTGSSNVNIVRPRQPVLTRTSNNFSPVRPQGNWSTAVKTSAGYNWRGTRPNSNYNSGSNFDHPLKNMEDRGIFDSGCSGHMTGNKDHLDDFEECKGGSVTFGGSKGYITGKGRIRVGNLDFDSVSFVKELGHFNLFSISQICDKHHKVLFTETECLVVSPDIKMPDENQILLKVHRQHNMYSFDMKTPSLTKDYACLIAKATSDESKVWHRSSQAYCRGVFVMSSTNSKAEAFLTELQHLKTQEKEAYSTGILEDTPKILAFRKELDELVQKHLREVPKNKAISTNSVNSGSGQDNPQPADQDDSDMSELTIFNKPQKGNFDEASYDDEGMVHDFNNLPTEVAVSPIPTLRIHNIHPQSQILGDPKSSVQTRSRVQQHSGAHALEEPKKISEALQDDSWVEAMQEELLQFRLQHVYILVDLPHGANVIGTKLLYRNKRDERGVVLSDEEVYVSQPPGFVDPDHPKKVYKVVKALYGLHQALRAWYATLSTFLEKHGYRRGTINKTLFIKKDKKDIMLVQVYVDDIIFGSTRKSWCDEFEALMKDRFQISSMGELIFFLGLQVKQKTDGIFISQDKYVADMLKKFDLTSVKTAIIPMETKMSLTKDKEADEVDVTPKTSHLNVVKRIFKYLKGKPNFGLWKSITGGCQFLGSRLISWQCKKQTIVATSTTEAKYVAAASCCGQVLWIQNQMLDYGFNFINIKIHIDNESRICILKNPVYHSKIKHIEIRHHFIRDSYEKKLIRVEKTHTDFNVADLLTKAFDGPRFNFLVVHIGMINP